MSVLKQPNVINLEVNSNKKIHITQKVIGAIKKRQKAYFIRDTKLIGFAIKVNPKGQSKFIVESRISGSGRNKRRELGVVGVMQLSQARDLARDFLNDIQSGVEPVERKLKNELTLEALAEFCYRTNLNIKKTRVDSYLKELKFVLKPFLNRKASDFSSLEYLEFYHKNVKKRPAVMDRIHRQLKAVYNFGIDKKLVESNPTAIVTKHDRPIIKPRERSLSLDLELPKFMKSLVEVDIPSVYRDAIWLLIATGMRKTEALSLKWSEVDFYRYIILLEDTKNKHSHLIPMSNLIRAMLTARYNSPDRHEKYVFPNALGKNPISDIRKPVAKILKNSEVDHLAPHDLRRTFTAIGQQHGLEIYEIEALLNHVNKSTANKHYIDKTSPGLIKKRRAILNQFSEYLERMATGYKHGVRFKSYSEGLFDEEKDDLEGGVTYNYQVAKEQLEAAAGCELTDSDVKNRSPSVYKLRNEALERAYDIWEMD